MLQKSSPIGVMDSGVGGLTVVRELQRVLPSEDIIYFGDSANCPYGNRTADDIAALSEKALEFLNNRHVKAVAISCNTISALSERLVPRFDFNIIDIIAPAADYVVRTGLKRVGLIATEFTVSTGIYDRLICAQNPSIEVISKGSPLLAALVERGDFEREEIDEEIKIQVGDILSRGEIHHLMLACTHYPIIEEHFARCFPALKLINPAFEQALAMRDYLAGQQAINEQAKGKFTICTSGDPQIYVDVARRLGLFEPEMLCAVSL